jgi:hypothetical protein
MKKIVGVLVGGLAFLLLSCEKEAFLKGTGEKVRVTVSLDDVAYGAGETVTRGSRSEMETVWTSLGDGMFMYATLEEDVEAPLRAVKLENGVKVRVIAYNGSTAEDTQEYTVSGGALTSAAAMEVTVGTTYTFVAYSYNSDVSPTYPGPTITVASPHDLLWGSTPKTITATDNSVSITMSHKFAQVKVKATTESVSKKPVIKALSGVTVTPGNPVDLTIETGATAPNAAAAAQTILSWNNLETTEVLSNPITVYTGTSNPVYVNIGSVTLDGYDTPFTNAQATFKRELTAGSSYILVVNFQRTIWAKSNIYWKWNDDDDHTQEGYLTFDTQENGHQGYQGVFFKWGSLVGISPAQPDAFSGSTPIYVPVVNATLTSKVWTATTGAAQGWTTWSINDHNLTEVPYLDLSYTDISYGRDNRYAIEAERNDYATYAGFRGDICQYLSTKTKVVTGDYRLPTSNEFGPLAMTIWADAAGWIKGIDPFPSANTAAGKADGTADLLDSSKNPGNIVAGSAINQLMGGVVFPASGYRWQSGGELNRVGNNGYYWSGSMYDMRNGCNLFFSSGVVASNSTHYRSYGHSVRCVQN